MMIQDHHMLRGREPCLRLIPVENQTGRDRFGLKLTEKVNGKERIPGFY